MRLPTKETLEYAKLLGEVLLLLLLLPCITYSLMRDPSRAVDHARLA